jgi:hypothetical protein
VGVAPAVLRATIDALEAVLGTDCARSIRLLLALVLGK